MSTPSAGLSGTIAPVRLALVSSRQIPDPSAADTDDAVCIEQSVAKPEVFASLFDRHAPIVHRYLSRRVGDVADDLLSETFLAAFRGRAGYRSDRATVRQWLLGIATNLLRRHARTEERRYRALARAAPEQHDPIVIEGTIDRLDAQALRAELAAALASLKPADRDVLLLSAWAELNYAEIAQTLNIPIGTVRSRLNRARRITQTHLAAHDLSIGEQP